MLLVEDDAWVRRAVDQALRATEPALDVEPCATGGAALAAAGRAGPDLALVDLGLPDMSGIVVIAELRRRVPACVAIAFTIFDDAPTILAALRAGARGYLMKSAPIERLVASLHEARAGGMVLSPSVASLLVERVLGGASAEPEAALTVRETELLGLLARGATYAQCATALGIGLGTVQGYVKSIYGKLEVSTKAEAAVAAVRLGLVR